MRGRALILLSVAILLALGTAFLARSWLASQRNQEVKEAASIKLQQPARSVLVARQPIARGQILRPDDLVWQPWPEGGLDKNYVVLGPGSKKPESYSGWVAINPIYGGEPVTEQKIISPGSKGFLAAVLHPGMRAISVPVTVTSGISGFIFPGDYVDILMMYAIPSKARIDGRDNAGSAFEHRVAETVLRNVRVIAIDQRLQSKAGEAVVAHTATFEVTPKDGEVVALANEVGKLALTLRSLTPGPGEEPEADATTTDKQSASATPLTTSGLISTAHAETAAAPGGAAPIPVPAITTQAVTTQAVTIQASTTQAVAAGAAPSGTVASATTTTTAPAAGSHTAATKPGETPTPGSTASYTIDNEISSFLPPLRGDAAGFEVRICKGPHPFCRTLELDAAAQLDLQRAAAEAYASQLARERTPLPTAAPTPTPAPAPAPAPTLSR